MYKLVAIFKKPADIEAFRKHYFDVHMPLTEKMPGLQRVEIAEVEGTPMGESPFYLITEMYFADRDSLNAAMASAEGRASGRDVMGFAGDIVSMHIARVVE